MIVIDYRLFKIVNCNFFCCAVVQNFANDADEFDAVESATVADERHCINIAFDLNIRALDNKHFVLLLAFLRIGEIQMLSTKMGQNKLFTRKTFISVQYSESK